MKKRVLKKWQGPHNFDHSKVLENKKHTKLIGAKGNNAISKYLLKNINCIFGYELFKIERIRKNWKLSFLKRNLSSKQSTVFIKMFQEILKQEYSTAEVCRQIQKSMDHPSRLELLHVLFGLSASDGEIHSEEVRQVAVA